MTTFGELSSISSTVVYWHDTPAMISLTNLLILSYYSLKKNQDLAYRSTSNVRCFKTSALQLLWTMIFIARSRYRRREMAGWILLLKLWWRGFGGNSGSRSRRVVKTIVVIVIDTITIQYTDCRSANEIKVSKVNCNKNTNTELRGTFVGKNSRLSWEKCKVCRFCSMKRWQVASAEKLPTYGDLKWAVGQKKTRSSTLNFNLLNIF